MFVETIYENIQSAEPVTQVEAALNDDFVEAGIISEAFPTPLIASRLFNVATASMIVLCTNPNTPLIKRPIKMPDTDDRLGRLTVKILNGSLLHSNFRYHSLTSPNVNIIPTPPNTEDEIMSAAGHGESAQSPTPLLLVDSKGLPILLKNQAGPNVAISLKAIAVNKVKIPAGSLFNVIVRPNTATTNSENGNFMIAGMSSIQAIGPQRFSALSFQPENRQSILKPVDGYEQCGAIGIAALYGTLTDITKMLPMQQELRQAYSKLKPR